MTNCKTVSRTRFSQAEAISRFREMADVYKRNVGRGIKKLRLNKGWTQQELADEIPDRRANSQRVSEWERGINLPQKHLPALAKALGVTENHILAGEPEKVATTTEGDSPLDGLSNLEPNKLAGRLDRLEVEVGEIGSVVREIRAILRGRIGVATEPPEDADDEDPDATGRQAARGLGPLPGAGGAAAEPETKTAEDS